MSLFAGLGSLAGGALGAWATNKANKENVKFQKRFAKQGIQWRVADAEKAGIHPLYALGAQTASFTPSVQPVTDGSAVDSATREFSAMRAARLAEREVESRIESNRAQAGYYKAQALASMQARKAQFANSGQDAVAQALADPFGNAHDIGVGTSHQDLENEYGEAANIEGAYRYVRDRAIPAAAKGTIDNVRSLLSIGARIGEFLKNQFGSSPRRNVNRRGRLRSTR
ncbi:MAG: hypothetical protein QW518_08940 [Thermofilaceae archaeon]